MTNVGKWDHRFAKVRRPIPYGSTESYHRGAAWLADCALVEDWGCGRGYLRTIIPPERYRGIDGSRSRFVDEIVDLAEYRSDVPGIFLRHVLEHDVRWAEILDNAVASFRERMVLILFTPLAEVTHQYGWNDQVGVPDLAFAVDDLAAHFPADVHWDLETIDAPQTQYGTETLIYLARLPRARRGRMAATADPETRRRT